MAEIGYFRAIFRSGFRVWGEAILEITVVAGVSMIPLIGAAVREVLPLQSKIYLSDAFEKAFLSGQLLFYALGLIATVVWNSNRDFKSFFPLRSILNLYCVAAIASCSVVIGYDPTLASENREFIAKFSLLLFLTSIIFYVLMSVIGQVHVNVGKSISESDDTLRDAVRESRGLQ
jgi:hypothetical protein